MELSLQRFLEADPSDLHGLRVDASIPVPEQVLNEIIVSTLTGNSMISSCQISIAEQNRVDVEVKTKLWPWPLHLKLRLFGAVDLTGSPTVRAFLENNVLLGQLGSFLNALPPGIHLYKDQISIDVGNFIQSPEQERLVALLKSVDIRTGPGRLILDVKAEA